MSAILSLHPATLAFVGGVPMAILFLGIVVNHVIAVREYGSRRHD